jgi:SAM-dependent methyltransferase
VADRQQWEGRWAAAFGADGTGTLAQRAPSAWVIDRCLALPPHVTLVDVAAGVGRHAVPLARQGRRVVAVDYVARAILAAVGLAADAGCRLDGVVADARVLPFAAASLDAILTVNFLDRALFPAFAALLKPGGWLIAETYTREHGALVEAGRSPAPRDPAYMLESGELRRLVAPLAVIAYREGLVRDAAGERYVAGVVARRDASAGV